MDSVNFTLYTNLMARTALSQAELDDFRETLCENATRLFAEHGYEGVTMRALATSLGCSPMTPYRYFKNKAEIFEAVRTSALSRFADAQEEAVKDVTEPAERLRALGYAYVRFATDEPHAYRIMFELDKEDRAASQGQEDLRGWKVMLGTIQGAVASGMMDGDPEIVAHLLWSAVHGLVALHLSGHLTLGRSLEELMDALLERELSHLNG